MTIKFLFYYFVMFMWQFIQFRIDVCFFEKYSQLIWSLLYFCVVFSQKEVIFLLQTLFLSGISSQLTYPPINAFS